MDLALWALAFTVLDWPERRKAEAWAALQAGVKPALAPAQVRALAQLEADLPRRRREAAERGARLLLPGDAAEGPAVAALLDPLPYPVALWVRGALPPKGHSLAIVGSRQASRQGRDRARTWAKGLAETGVAVISGLARGIDAAAHLGALEAGPGGAGTWGVLGSGLDHPYPPEHAPLMDRMVAAGGGIITPFPPEAPPRKWHFPRRNWLLAAWSEGVLVVEARWQSGSMITARLALDLGKELWVVPGSEGPDTLLEEGAAHACAGPEEVVEALRNAPG